MITDQFPPAGPQSDVFPAPSLITSQRDQTDDIIIAMFRIDYSSLFYTDERLFFHDDFFRLSYEILNLILPT